MNKKSIILSAIFLLSIIFLGVGKPVYVSAVENETTIYKGVFIDKVDVSGMTKNEAQAAVDQLVTGLQSKSVTIKVNEEAVKTTMGDLGYTYTPNDNIDLALSLGRTGNLLKRYKDIKDVAQGNKVYPLTFTCDLNKLKDLITKKVSEYNLAPVNASVARKAGSFVYTDEVIGKKVNVDKTSAEVQNMMLNNWDRTDITVDAVMDEDIPKYTIDTLKKCNKLLGTYTTEYMSSAQGRASNLANGSRLINNSVVYPGEVFSSYDHLSPFTVAHGYYVAGAYLQGKVIDSVGGGACQVTTTLYNAVLNAELEVVQRQSHSMVISYVDLSRDAAIAGTYKDFKFKNNLDIPILIESYTQGRRITFSIWGMETRDKVHRTVKYKTVVLSQTNPPADVVTKDPTLPTTYSKVTQAAHIGYRAELYKIVYQDNVEVSRTLVNKSTYNAAPRYITVGTKKEKPKTDNSDVLDTSKENPSKIEDQKPIEEQKPIQDQTTEDNQNSTNDTTNPIEDEIQLQ